MGYKYEMHCHTSPVSRCARASVEETVDFYRAKGYDGLFITNHFIDGNAKIFDEMSYREKIEFYFSDYENGRIYGEKVGLKVFCGVELSYAGTDFLVYGLDKEWFLANEEICMMKKSEELPALQKAGGLVFQAHPYRDSSYIDHIRLFPKCVDGIEVLNASRPDFENEMALLYAKHYNLLRTAGSDNHVAGKVKRLAGLETDEPLCSVADFIAAIKEGKTRIFVGDNEAQRL